MLSCTSESVTFPSQTGTTTQTYIVIWDNKILGPTCYAISMDLSWFHVISFPLWSFDVYWPLCYSDVGRLFYFLQIAKIWINNHVLVKQPRKKKRWEIKYRDKSDKWLYLDNICQLFADNQHKKNWIIGNFLAFGPTDQVQRSRPGPMCRWFYLSHAPTINGEFTEKLGIRQQ